MLQLCVILPQWTSKSNGFHDTTVSHIPDVYDCCAAWSVRWCSVCCSIHGTAQLCYLQFKLISHFSSRFLPNLLAPSLRLCLLGNRSSFLKHQLVAWANLQFLKPSNNNNKKPDGGIITQCNASFCSVWMAVKLVLVSPDSQRNQNMSAFITHPIKAVDIMITPPALTMSMKAKSFTNSPKYDLRRLEIIMSKQVKDILIKFFVHFWLLS